jgi:hypothetical protein
VTGDGPAQARLGREQLAQTDLEPAAPRLAEDQSEGLGQTPDLVLERNTSRPNMPRFVLLLPTHELVDRVASPALLRLFCRVLKAFTRAASIVAASGPRSSSWPHILVYALYHSSLWPVAAAISANSTSTGSA